VLAATIVAFLTSAVISGLFITYHYSIFTLPRRSEA